MKPRIRVPAPHSKVPVHSTDSSPPRQYQELNTPRLILALLKLKSNPKFSDTPKNVIEKESIDGTCKFYSTERQSQVGPQRAPVPSPGENHEGITPQALEYIVARLRELSALQESSSEPDTPILVRRSLDDCTFVYVSDQPEPLDRNENLPSSIEEPIAPACPRYDFTSEHTMKFIQENSVRPRKDLPRTPSDYIVKRSLDNSILLICPGDSEKDLQRAPDLTVNIEKEDLRNPEAALILKKKLEALSVGQHAVDDDSIRIITLACSASSTSGVNSVMEHTSPVYTAAESPGVWTPGTQYKLFSKIQAIQEIEGEDAKWDIEGSTLFYVGDEIERLRRSLDVSRDSPSVRNTHSVALEEVSKKLSDLRDANSR